jgi:hypothetical protein
MGISLCCSLSGPCLVFARKQTLSNRQRSILGQHSGGDCNAVFTGRDERDRWDSRYKNPEPLHARAHDVKASVEAGVSPAKPPRSRKAATMVDRG